MTFALLFVVFSLLSLEQVSDYVRIPYKFIFWSDHRHSWSVANDAPKWSISIIYPLFSFLARFIIPAQKVLKRNIARYVVIIISVLGVISYLSVILR